MKRFLKILHTLGAIGLMGGFAAYMTLLATARDLSPADYAAVRRSIEEICKWLLVPSLPLVLVSGLLSMAIHSPFHNALWAWLKALTGVAMFEGTLGTIQVHARGAASLAAKAAAGQVDGAAMAEAVRGEWLGLVVLFALALLNVVLGVWRPRPRTASPDGGAH